MKFPVWKRILRRAAFVLPAALLIALLASCGAPASQTRTGAERVINIAFTTAWGDFNPYYSTSGTMYELAMYDKLYDKLIFTDLAGAEILPRAAQSWESADGGKTVIFHLDPDASWSDGKKVTASDWVFTINLLANPDSAFSTRVFTSALTGTDQDGARIDGEAVGADAPDDTTLRLFFKDVTDPEDFLLRYNRQFLVLPEHLLKDADPAKILQADFWKNPVGSGPCVFVSQVMGSEIVLAPNPYYHLGGGGWDKLILRVTDSSSRLTALMSGEIDMLVLGTDISADAKPLAEANGLIVNDAAVRNFFLEVLINADTIPDPLVRQALHHAVDKDAIAAASAKEVGAPAYSYEMPGSVYEDPSLVFPRNVEMAKELLAKAGYDGETYTIAFASKRENVAALLAQQWQEAGLHIEMVIVDVATMFSGLADGTYDLGISGHTASAYPLWFESEFPANENPAPDPMREDYVYRIRTTVDADQKTELVKEYQRYLSEKTYFIPLYFSGNYWVESSRVSGIKDSASLMCNDNVWEWKVN